MWGTTFTGWVVLASWWEGSKVDEAPIPPPHFPDSRCEEDKAAAAVSADFCCWACPCWFRRAATRDFFASLSFFTFSGFCLHFLFRSRAFAFASARFFSSSCSVRGCFLLLVASRLLGGAFSTLEAAGVAPPGVLWVGC